MNSNYRINKENSTYVLTKSTSQKINGLGKIPLSLEFIPISRICSLVFTALLALFWHFQFKDGAFSSTDVDHTFLSAVGGEFGNISHCLSGK